MATRKMISEIEEQLGNKVNLSNNLLENINDEINRINYELNELSKDAPEPSDLSIAKPILEDKNDTLKLAIQKHNKLLSEIQ